MRFKPLGERALIKPAEREKVSIETATPYVRAVFAVIEELSSPQEVSDVRAQLPNEYEALFRQG